MGGWLTPEFEAGGLRFRFNVVECLGDAVSLYLESPLAESGEWAWCSSGGYSPTKGGPGGVHWAVWRVELDGKKPARKWFWEKVAEQSREDQIAEAVRQAQSDVVKYFERKETITREESGRRESIIEALAGTAAVHGWTKQHSPEGRP